METFRLPFKGYNELYYVDLERVLYFQSDDHYAHVYYATGFHFMLPYGLSQIEAKLDEAGVSKDLVRMGRKYIVNVDRIFRINTTTEQLILCDDRGESVVLHVPKVVLRSYIDNS